MVSKSSANCRYCGEHISAKGNKFNQGIVELNLDVKFLAHLIIKHREKIMGISAKWAAKTLAKALLLYPLFAILALIKLICLPFAVIYDLI